MAAHSLAHTRWTTEDFEDDLQAAHEGLLLGDSMWDPQGGLCWRTWVYQRALMAIRADRGLRRGSGYRAAVGARTYFRSPISLSATLRLRGDGQRHQGLVDTIEARPLVTEPEDTTVLDCILAGLTDRERTIVTMTSREAADALGIQQTSVFRARVRLYARLRAEYGIDAPDASSDQESGADGQRDGFAHDETEAA